ncbi:MAG: hypothetical protein JW957_03625 [Candidatus Omnitrophica bacterium]|nr:hypothetical protein [Candidatus Omnitrophota bacterium]
MKNKGKQIVLVVVILIALAALVKSMGQQASYERILVDTQANKVFVKRISSNAAVEYPTSSPFSKGNNAYPALKCLNCEAVFGVKEKPIIESTEEMPASPQVMGEITPPTWPKCPVCGAVANAMVPVLPEGQKSMDVAGPVQLIEAE